AARRRSWGNPYRDALFQLGIDERGKLPQRDVAHVAAVLHQEVLKTEAAAVALLQRDAELNDVDRRELQVGGERCGAGERLIEVQSPVLDQLADECDHVIDGLAARRQSHAWTSGAM